MKILSLDGCTREHIFITNSLSTLCKLTHLESGQQLKSEWILQMTRMRLNRKQGVVDKGPVNPHIFTERKCMAKVMMHTRTYNPKQFLRDLL